MHAKQIVQRFIESELSSMHAARREPLAQAVSAVMRGHALSLSRVAQGTIGQGTLKSALKRVDRQIGCARTREESQLLCGAIVRQVSATVGMLVIALDWSAVAPGGAFAELRAVITGAGMGRGITLYQEVYAQAQQGSCAAEWALLERLQACVPAGRQVLIVTDAGFRQPWFARIEALGWQWIGRLRGGLELATEAGRWMKLKTMFAQASGRATRFTQCRLTRQHAWPCEVVMVRARKPGRKIYARPGHGATPKARREGRAAAAEPWVLAHSSGLNRYRAQQIVAWYGLRMQIEENFRDTKSTQFGMGLEMSRSRSAARLQGLLLIHTLAAFVLWHIGQLAEAEGMHRRFKATTRHAREISIIRLALLLCAQGRIPLSDHARTSLYERLGFRS